MFVTAYDEHAVDAFELQATDYVMKPVRAERLAEAVRRVLEVRLRAAAPRARTRRSPSSSAASRGSSRRPSVRFVEAQGDYARLHTDDGSHLVRVPLSTLEERWRPAGFVRIHRSTLVALRHVDEVRVDGGRCTVRLGGRRAAGQPPAHSRPARPPSGGRAAAAVTTARGRAESGPAIPRPGRPSDPAHAGARHQPRMGAARRRRAGP